MNPAAVFLDLLDRRAAPKSGDDDTDAASILKAAAAALSGGLLVAFDLADKVGALLTSDRAMRFHAQTVAALAVIGMCVATYTATTPGAHPGARLYKYPRALRLVAKAGFFVVSVVLVSRLVHLLPARGTRWIGYVCEASTGRPVDASTVSVLSIFDEPLGPVSTLGGDGSFEITVPAGGHAPEKLAVSGCAGTAALSSAKTGRGCSTEDGPEWKVWRVTCASK